MMEQLTEKYKYLYSLIYFLNNKISVNSIIIYLVIEFAT